jgi:hypothetical protein
MISDLVQAAGIGRIDSQCSPYVPTTDVFGQDAIGMSWEWKVAATTLNGNITRSAALECDQGWQCKGPVMSQASWDEAGSPEINWRMSAALENVPRGNEDLAEVTSLEGAVRAWLALDPPHRSAATLTLEHPLLIDGASIPEFSGEGIGALAERLPEHESAGPSDEPVIDEAG